MQEMLLPNQSAHPSLFRLFPAQTADEIHRLLHRLPLCQVPYIHGSFSGQMPSMPEISEVQELHIRSYVQLCAQDIQFSVPSVPVPTGMFPSKHLIPHLNNPVTHMPADFRRLRIRLCGKRKITTAHTTINATLTILHTRFLFIVTL